MALPDRILVEVAPGELRPVDPAEVYFLEAEGERTRLRLRSARSFVFYRALGALEPLFGPHGFLRIHRNHMVNLRRIQTMTEPDVKRCREILAQYGDLGPGLVDAAVIATAERLRTDRILTVDERDLRALLSRTGKPFVLLPADV